MASRKTLSPPSVRLFLEVLEDRTLLSGSAMDPLPAASAASPQPPVAAVMSYVRSAIDQWDHLVVMV